MVKNAAGKITKIDCFSRSIKFAWEEHYWAFILRSKNPTNGKQLILFNIY